MMLRLILRSSNADALVGPATNPQLVLVSIWPPGNETQQSTILHITHFKPLQDVYSKCNACSVCGEGARGSEWRGGAWTTVT